MNNEYQDIINLPHHVSEKHASMSMQKRAAQFAPFAALGEDSLQRDENSSKRPDRKHNMTEQHDMSE